MGHNPRFRGEASAVGGQPGMLPDHESVYTSAIQNPVNYLEITVVELLTYATNVHNEITKLINSFFFFNCD